MEKYSPSGGSVLPFLDPLKLKLLMLGETGVGKSSIMYRFTNNEFTHGLIGTAGLDFKTKAVQIRNRTVILSIWDTAGQERFKTITEKYFEGVPGIILVYDITD